MDPKTPQEWLRIAQALEAAGKSLAAKAAYVKAFEHLDGIYAKQTTGDT